MKKTLLFLLFLLTAVSSSYGQLTINHNHRDITTLTESEITLAKANLHIVYGHTSHGSQITTGMNGLITFANNGGKGLSHPTDIFDWDNGGTNGALDLHDNGMAGDVGYYPEWVDETETYLDDPANSDVNVVMWSWCGQVDDKYDNGTLLLEYLEPMAALELAYPNVLFVYMTGHLDHWDEANNKAANQMIRDYCAANNKILYDFADIESYDPDGTYFEFAHDNCNYYSSTGTLLGNWATEWRASHTEDVDWYNCGSAHSDALNANQKAYAAWHLFAELAKIIADTNTYSLTVNASGAASVTINGAPGTYGGVTNYSIADIESSTNITLTAPAVSGSANFSGWTGCTSTTGSVCVVNLTGDTTVTATYITPAYYDLTVNSSGTDNVSITGAPASFSGTTNYTHADILTGSTITLTAPNTSGETIFSRWTGCTSSSGVNCTVNLTGDTTVTATYITPAYYDLTVNSSGTGDVSIAGIPASFSGTTNYTHADILSGSTITLTAPNTSGEAVFFGWTGCASTSMSSCTLSMTDNITVTANYVTPTYSLTVDSSRGPGINISGMPAAYGGTTQYIKTGIPLGTIIVLTAPTSPELGDFSDWTGCDSVSATSCTVVMTSDKSCVAHYRSGFPWFFFQHIFTLNDVVNQQQ